MENKFMAKVKTQSVEPMVADLVNGWLKSYGLDYKLEQETLNSEIDKALNEYASKSGGTGAIVQMPSSYSKISILTTGLS